MVKRVWSDPVGSKVIAVTILGLMGAAYSYLNLSWSNITAFLRTTQAIPNWVIVISSVPILLCLLHLTGLIRLGKRPVPADNPQRDVAQLAIDIKKKMHRLAEEAEIKIIHPPDKAEARTSIQVIGSCKNLPEGFEIYVFTISRQRKEVNYWTRRCLEVKDQRWSTEIDIQNYNPGERRNFGVFLVGRNGQALIRLFMDAGRKMRNGQAWTPFTELTDDMIECETREVIITR